MDEFRWYRPKTLAPDPFARAVADCRTVCEWLAPYLILRGPAGTGVPLFSERQWVSFNGDGSALGAVEPLVPYEWPVKDRWVPSATYEVYCNTYAMDMAFLIERQSNALDMYGGQHCTTNNHPYTLAITACLVVFKHCFPKVFLIEADSTEQRYFLDGMIACHLVLGYGLDFACGG